MNIKVKSIDIICAYSKFKKNIRDEEIDYYKRRDEYEHWIEDKSKLPHCTNISTMSNLRKMAEYTDTTQFRYVVVDIDEFNILELYL